jgi:hypothetical protein
VDVDVNVIVSKVSGNGGETENDATGATAVATGGKTDSAKRRPSASPKTRSMPS